MSMDFTSTWHVRWSGGLDILTTIKENIITGKWYFSYHALKKCDERDIDIEKLVISLLNGELLEGYPDDPRGNSCLILSHIESNPVHSVCGIHEGSTVFITAYRPEPPKWVNERTRREQH